VGVAVGVVGVDRGQIDLGAHVFSSSTGALIRELVAESQADAGVSREFVDHFWQPRRDLSTAFLQRAIERGQVRPDLDIEAALDAIYSPLWTRLLIGHGPLNLRLVDEILRWFGAASPHEGGDHDRAST
jgi:hypothetical protein